ncbi:MAG: hypothetical protein II645_05325 [Bacteroidaceae bacterium]|nr:hypothetical protein [Bacteroidaceae bacterium]
MYANFDTRRFSYATRRITRATRRSVENARRRCRLKYAVLDAVISPKEVIRVVKLILQIQFYFSYI